MPNVAQNMLYVLSARHTMRWSAYKTAFDELIFDVAISRGWSPDDVRRVRRSLVRVLQSLGHTELVEQDNGLEVTVAPPALVRLPIAGQAIAVLAGWRSPSMLGQLRQISLDSKLCVEFSNEQANSDTHLQPSRWLIRACKHEQLNTVASRLGIEDTLRPPACALGAMAPSIAQHLDSLEWGALRDIPPGALSFDLASLRFLHDYRRDAATGLWRIPVPTSARHRHVIRLGGRQAFVQLDYGRWALAAHHGRRMCFYDARTFSLSAPAALPLPVLLARAAALCSGRMPRSVESNGPEEQSSQATRLEYIDIPPLLGRQLLAKLSLTAGYSVPTTRSGA